MRQDLENLLLRLRELKDKVREVECDLCHEISIFSGTLEQAIGAGIVKPAFSVPPGFVRMCKDKVSKDPKPVKQ